MSEIKYEIVKQIGVCSIPSYRCASVRVRLAVPKRRTARNYPTTVSLRGCFAREGEQSAGMKIMIYAQVEVVLPLFCPAFAGHKWGKLEGGSMPRPQRSNPKTKHQAVKLRKESTPAE